MDTISCYHDSIFVLYGLAMAALWLSLADISIHLDLHIKLDRHVSYILAHCFIYNSVSGS